MYSQGTRHHHISASTTMATTNAAGELLPTAAALAAVDDEEGVEELDGVQFAPEAAAGMELAADADGESDTVDVTMVEADADVDSPRSSTLLCADAGWHSPSIVPRTEALAMAAGVEPQLMYCCMWTAFVSRSKTAVGLGGIAPLRSAP